MHINTHKKKNIMCKVLSIFTQEYNSNSSTSHINVRAQMSVFFFLLWLLEEQKWVNRGWRREGSLLDHLFNILTVSEEKLTFPYEHLAICFKNISSLTFKNRPCFTKHRHLRASAEIIWVCGFLTCVYALPCIYWNSQAFTVKYK